MFQVKVRATCIVVTPGSEAIMKLTPIVKLLTYEDEYQETVNTLGILLDDVHDVLYIHKGVNLAYLQRLLEDVEFIQEPPCKYQEMKFDFEEIISPRDNEQVDVIDFIAGRCDHSDNKNESRIFLVKKAGFGKTFCSGYGIGLLGMKTLIIMHRDDLRSQWTNSLFTMNGYPEDRVHELTSSEEIEALVHGTITYDYDVYLMTHATFLAALKRINDFELMGKLAENLGIGLKIIDEAHLYFKNTLLIDYTFNIKRNLYLTATDGRSSRDENAIFKHVFSNAIFYKKKVADDEKHPSKWVEYIAVGINTHVKKSMYTYRINGGRGMNPATYGKWVIAHDKKQTHFKVCTEIIRELFTNLPSAKIIVFMPLIDLCTECAYFISTKLNYDESFPLDLTVRTVNSHNSKKENEYNKRADVIVTTIASLGTGSDIKGITDIICCSPYVSKITAEQVLGRIRYIDKPCHYYDIIDTSVPSDIYWWKSRSKKLKSLATKFTKLRWYEEEEGGNDDKCV